MDIWYRQLDLERGEEPEKIKATITVVDRKDLAVGVFITIPKFTGENTWWKVTRVGRKRLRPRTDWKIDI